MFYVPLLMISPIEKDEICKHAGKAQRGNNDKSKIAAARQRGERSVPRRFENEDPCIICKVRADCGQNRTGADGDKRQTNSASKLIQRLFGIVVKERKQSARNKDDGKRSPSILVHLSCYDSAEYGFFKQRRQHRDH